MISESRAPDDPLTFIQRRVKEQKIFWTYHVNMRMKARSISRRMILESVSSYEIIEENPADRYFPSYLVYSRYMDSVCHILFATDIDDNNVRVITAYYPDPVYWSQDLKTRRKP